MINEFRTSGRLGMSVLLCGMTLICFGLFFFRHSMTGSRSFFFLNWNLFLAFVPWMFSTMVMLKPGLQRNRLAMFSLLGVWILFFPNSPYILTDLFHLQQRAGMPMWFDLVLILAFAWTGLSYGFISLLDIESLLSKRLGRKTVTSIIVSLLFITSFGIYLGRFQRWNSWDILQSPLHLLADIGDRFLHPFAYPRTWGMTLFMGILLNMIFWTIKLVKRDGVAGASWTSSVPKPVDTP